MVNYVRAIIAGVVLILTFGFLFFIIKIDLGPLTLPVASIVIAVLGVSAGFIGYMISIPFTIALGFEGLVIPGLLLEHLKGIVFLSPVTNLIKWSLIVLGNGFTAVFFANIGAPIDIYINLKHIEDEGVLITLSKLILLLGVLNSLIVFPMVVSNKVCKEFDTSFCPLAGTMGNFSIVTTIIQASIFIIGVVSSPFIGMSLAEKEDLSTLLGTIPGLILSLFVLAVVSINSAQVALGGYGFVSGG